MDSFLLGHFKWTLKRQITGGDVYVDYPDGGVGLMNDALTKPSSTDLANATWKGDPRPSQEARLIFLIVVVRL